MYVEARVQHRMSSSITLCLIFKEALSLNLGVTNWAGMAGWQTLGVSLPPRPRAGITDMLCRARLCMSSVPQACATASYCLDPLLSLNLPYFKNKFTES